MAKARRQFIDGDYGQIHLRMAAPDRPTERPLVCLHMFPQSGRNFEHFMAEASVDRVVVAPDFPGYGESDPPPAPITVSDYAKSVWDVADALELGKQFGTFDVFGIHAGAKLAVEVVRQRPGDINKVFLSSAAVLYPDELDRLKKTFSPIPLDEEGTRFQHLWSLLVKNRSQDMTDKMMAEAFAEMLRGGEAYEWGHSAVFEFNQQFPDVLASLPHPIALLNPGDDLYEKTPRSLKYIQNGELFDVPEWNHGFLEKRAAEAAKLVRDWLAKDTSASAPPANTLTA